MRKTRIFSTVALLFVTPLLTASSGSAQEASRYPYDPVCEWGRIANGKGMLVRCITQAEASALLAGPAAPVPAPAPTPSTSSSAEPPPPDTTAIALASIVVTPDQGKLPAAEKKLMLGKDKFVDCVVKNGGLEKNEGEVHVRFLVGDRGRAQGVSVQKRVALGEKAASCVADVVDRRWVGVPESPLTPVTAVVKFTKAKS
jgi:outer membrane biosynthesis protein TonB